MKGYGWDQKQVYRIYRDLELSLRIKPKKRILRKKRTYWLSLKPSMNAGRWASCTTQLEYGRSYRLFNVLDDFNREGLAVEVELSLPVELIIRVLDQVIECHGQPQALHCDNSPGYFSCALSAWALKRVIRPGYIRAREATTERLFRDLQPDREV